MRVVRVLYHDHYEQTLTPNQAHDPPGCMNVVYGEVIHEDAEWVRICYEKTGINESETWGVITVRKADIENTTEYKEA